MAKLLLVPNKIIKRIVLCWENSAEKDRALIIYRYISLIITSVFYLYSYQDHLIIRKALIIGGLSISTVILSYLYPTYRDSKVTIRFLLFIEIIANTSLLIPSGGIRSPFIWYSLNTYLISSIYLSKMDFFLNLIIYIFGLAIINNIEEGMYLYNLPNVEGSYFILSFVIIIIAILIFGALINRISKERKILEDTNEQLENANMVTLDSMNHIKDLYQSVNILANQGNREGIIKLSFEHIRKVTKTDMVFYLELDSKTDKVMSLGGGFEIESIKQSLKRDIKANIDYIKPREITLDMKRYVIVSVSSNYQTYGLLGLKVSDKKHDISYQNNLYQLQFLGELISIAFERLDLEGINERLLVSEEQNRIANEIHDNVLQRLFSMSCSIFSIIKNQRNYSEEEIEDQLNILRETTAGVMKDLRNTIYGLSWKKGGQSSFIQDIRGYIDDIKILNDVNIPFSILGNVEILSTNQKRALYRIICEGIGNAIRHGKANFIEVTINIKSDQNELKIIDNGLGFDVYYVVSKEINGLGLSNIKQLVESLQGVVSIQSKIGQGTSIEAIIPNFVALGEKEEMI